MFNKCKALICAVCSIILLSIFSVALAQDIVNADDPISVNKDFPIEGSGKTSVQGIASGEELVDYNIINGKMIMEGDILLGDVPPSFSGDGTNNAIRLDPRYRWPNGVVPYQFDTNLSTFTQLLMRNAFREWESKVPVRFIEHTVFNSSIYPDSILIVNDELCYSFVGRTGGKQQLSMGPDCNIGASRHELGHALGLWHEQSRPDRDSYVKINYENIQNRFASNFNKYTLDQVFSVTPYDYYSIMHYPPNAFSVNGLPTIETTNPAGVNIGFSTDLSDSDVIDVKAMYPDGVLEEVIVDNTDLDEISQSGEWSNYFSYLSQYGENTEMSNDSNASFTWNLVVPTTGIYALQTFWTTRFADSTTNAMYLIQWPGGSETVVVDQNEYRNSTLYEGEFFAGDQVTITATNAGVRNSWLNVDMTRLIKIGGLETEADRSIVDNLDVDSISKQGSWAVSGAASPYEVDSEFSFGADASFTWNLVVPETDYYQVQAYWTYWDNRTDAARYTVQTPQGVETVVLDQKENASTWFTLFEGNYTEGDEITITVTNDSGGSLSADATRVLKAEEPTAVRSIVDNLDLSLINKQGTWAKSGGANPYGVDSEFSMSADASFTWNLVVPETDNYQIQTYWTYFPNRTNEAIYTIQTPLGTTTKVFDQNENASTWVTLLDGGFTAGDQIQITVTNGAGVGSLSADASRLEVSESSTVEVIIDNQDTSVTRSGFWGPSGGLNPFSGQSEYSFIGTFNWEALLPEAGLYKVEAYWTEFANRTDAAAYEIQHANGIDTVSVNQKSDGGQWIELGQYDFAAGTANILLSNTTGEGTLSADAVRFTLIR